jgi:hypothetical protein
MPCPNPFKPEDCDQISQTLQVVQDYLELAAKCKSCGLEVSGYEEDLNNIKGTLQAIKREFFPNRN